MGVRAETTSLQIPVNYIFINYSYYTYSELMLKK